MAGLLEHVRGLLPPDRRAIPLDPAGERFAGPRGVTSPDPALLRQVRRAVRRQQIQFRYRSPFAADPDGIEHRAAPYGLLVREGHSYLDADCLWADSPEWRPRPLHYRLDRIIPGTLRVLLDTVPPLRLPAPRYEVRYLLSPAVARQRDVALHFADSRVTHHPDGSALISATTDNLWQARQVLLRYGASCRVESPPELITMMRETIQELAALYGP